MENAWNEYKQLERDVDWLKSALQGQMNRSDLPQVVALKHTHAVVLSNTHTHEAERAANADFRRDKN